MAENTPTPFTWGDIELSQTVFIDGVPHATRSAIGNWLEYADSRKHVDKVIERNPHIEHYSTTVNLTAVDGKKRQVSVYHPIGFMLITMESGQPKAQAMKVAVAEFVWHFAGPQQRSFKEIVTLRNQRVNILAKLEKSGNIFVREGLLNDLRAVSLSLGCEVPDALLLNNADPRQGDLTRV